MLQRRFDEVAEVLRAPRQSGLLVFTATILARSWGLYLLSMHSDRVVETSFDDDIIPLVDVLPGVLLLKEKLDRTQVLLSR